METLLGSKNNILKHLVSSLFELNFQVFRFVMN